MFQDTATLIDLLFAFSGLGSVTFSMPSCMMILLYVLLDASKQSSRQRQSV